MFRPLATSALALILGAGAALADVTPAEVWESLERTYTDMGYQVDVGTRNEDGATLRLENVTLGAAPDATGQFSATFPAIVLTDAGDGTVRSVIEGDIALTSRVPDRMGREGGFDAVMQMPGNETLSSGTPEEMQHRYAIPELRLTGTALDSEGESPLTMVLTDLQGNQGIRQVTGGGNTQSYDLRAARMQVQLSGQGPALDAEGEPDMDEAAAAESFTADITAEQLALVGTGTTPGGELDFENNPAEALRQGLTMDGRLSVGPFTATMQSSRRSAEGEETSGTGTAAAEAGEIGFALSQTGLTFEGTTRNMQVEGTGDEMPMPLSYGVATGTARLVMPLLQAEAPQPFSLTYALEGITLDESLWASFDPESQLPRDPANLNIDLSGEAVIATDLINADGMEQTEELPIQPRSLSVNRMALNALGATAEFGGQLTFGEDPSQPVGTLSGDITGINQLLDTMVAMGVLPQEQLMGTRMMLAMFARPVEGEPDRLRTELEFRDDGSIFANGQQVQ